MTPSCTLNQIWTSHIKVRFKSCVKHVQRVTRKIVVYFPPKINSTKQTVVVIVWFVHILAHVELSSRLIQAV